MLRFIVANEPVLRLSLFLGVLAVMMAWEAIAPRRSRTLSRWRRWPGNLGIVLLDAAALRLAGPVSAVSVAVLAEQQGWGLLNAVPMPGWVAVAVAVMALDLAIYLQHVLVHAVPVLWRLHRMHHADLDIDVATGVRFHPIEIVLSMGLKCGAVAALGAPVAAVILFEMILNATSMFNHANVRMPEALERVLRHVVVTPDMHRVHHSIRVEETNSNFGFNLPWWDRLFGTYRAQPGAGHARMTIGIDQFRDPRELRLDRMLLQPFRDGVGAYPRGHRAPDA
jgi:sterol desaturase/sphingolipid hydroxylase (fatty acid hydroxylase superfamily)